MSYFLGIDVGTSSVKIVVAERQEKTLSSIVYENSKQIENLLGCCTGPILYEQNVADICLVLEDMLNKMPHEIKSKIGSIGICGQMHGILFWNKLPNEKDNSICVSEVIKTQASRLYNWQDQRCSPDFLRSLPKPSSEQNIATGFGLATAFWLLQHQPGFLERYLKCFKY